MQDLMAIRVIPNSKVTMDITGSGKDKVVNGHSYRKLVKDFYESKKPLNERTLVGIVPKINRLLVIDVDAGGTAHKFDGRPWWNKFLEDNPIPPTYTVGTKNGGFHYYFRIPASLEPDQIIPPKELAKGVEVIYNGYVLAPPSPGYTILNGTVLDIPPVPPVLMMAIENARDKGNLYFDTAPKLAESLGVVHQPFSEEQVNALRDALRQFQEIGNPSYDEWRDGLFSLKSGCGDRTELLQELVYAFCRNQAYQPGDEEKAMAIVDKCDPNGPIGPGTIFNILKDIRMRQVQPMMPMPSTRFDILNKAGIRYNTGASGEPRVKPSESNAASILDVLFEKDRLYYDARNRMYVFDGAPISDEELINIMIPYMQSEKGMGLTDFRKPFISQGLELLMYNRRRDPHLEMLNTIQWDGKKRIDRFFTTYMGCIDNEYHRMVARCFWISLAARGLNPGAKVDFMLILEGPEGINKSSLVKIIGGDYTFAPVKPDLFINENELRKMHQSVVVELPELLGLMGQDPKVAKGYLTTNEDSIRPLYGKKAYPHPRGFVFIGTTNNRRYLDDEMGDRRWLPVSLQDCIIKSADIKADREQLFAEAVHRYKAGEPWWNIDKDMLSKVISKKRITDPLEFEIKAYCQSKAFVSITQVFKFLSSQDLVQKSLTTPLQARIVAILVRAGFEEEETVEGSMWKNPCPVNHFSGYADFSNIQVSDLI